LENSTLIDKLTLKYRLEICTIYVRVAASRAAKNALACRSFPKPSVIEVSDLVGTHVYLICYSAMARFNIYFPDVFLCLWYL